VFSAIRRLLASTARGQIVGSFGAGVTGHGFLEIGGSITQIDVPGGFGTQALGVNDAGQIVGTFSNSSAPFNHGFLRNPDGSFTTIDVFL